VFVLRMHESRIVDTINMDHEGVCLYCVRTEYDFYADIDPIVFSQWHIKQPENKAKYKNVQTHGANCTKPIPYIGVEVLVKL